MGGSEPIRFNFIRAACKDLPEVEIVAAEESFVEYLCVVAEIAKRLVQQGQVGDNRFDETSPAPYDSIPPASNV